MSFEMLENLKGHVRPGVFDSAHTFLNLQFFDGIIQDLLGNILFPLSNIENLN